MFHDRVISTINNLEGNANNEIWLICLRRQDLICFYFPESLWIVQSHILYSSGFPQSQGTFVIFISRNIDKTYSAKQSCHSVFTISKLP